MFGVQLAFGRFISVVRLRCVRLGYLRCVARWYATAPRQKGASPDRERAGCKLVVYSGRLAISFTHGGLSRPCFLSVESRNRAALTMTRS